MTGLLQAPGQWTLVSFLFCLHWGTDFFFRNQSRSQSTELEAQLPPSESMVLPGSWLVALGLVGIIHTSNQIGKARFLRHEVS